LLSSSAVYPSFPYTTLFRSRTVCRQLGSRLFALAFSAQGAAGHSPFVVSRNCPPQRLIPHTQPIALPLPLAFLSFPRPVVRPLPDRKSTRLNSSHLGISYAV